jgi:hypothetical protein
MGRCEWTERNGAMADRILADSDASGWPALVTGTPGWSRRGATTASRRRSEFQVAHMVSDVRAVWVDRIRQRRSSESRRLPWSELAQERNNFRIRARDIQSLASLRSK